MVNILVAEDSAVDRALIGGLLAKETAWEVEFACDGVEALERLQGSKPHGVDVVVTDLQMPNLDGLGLVTEVRKHFPELPVILITSHGSEEIAVQALRAGATSYSPKSLLRADLVRTIKDRLASAISRLNPNLPTAAVEEVAQLATKLPEPSIAQNNRTFHRFLMGGVPIDFANAQGEADNDQARLIRTFVSATPTLHALHPLAAFLHLLLTILWIRLLPLGIWCQEESKAEDCHRHNF